MGGTCPRPRHGDIAVRVSAYANCSQHYRDMSLYQSPTMRPGEASKGVRLNPRIGKHELGKHAGSNSTHRCVLHHLKTLGSPSTRSHLDLVLRLQDQHTVHLLIHSFLSHFQVYWPANRDKNQAMGRTKAKQRVGEEGRVAELEGAMQVFSLTYVRND